MFAYLGALTSEEKSQALHITWKIVESLASRCRQIVMTVGLTASSLLTSVNS